MRQTIYRLNSVVRRKAVCSIFYCKASSAENQLSQEQAQFYQTLTQDYSTQFANQSAILSGLKSAFTPILQAGPSQQGFSTQELNALQTNATQNITGTYQQAQTALNEKQAGESGYGTAGVTSGVNSQLDASLLSSAANQESTAQNEITQANWQQGLQNFYQAASILGNTAQQYSPLGYAGATSSAGNTAFNMASTIQQQNSTWQGELGGLVGGVAGSFLGGDTLGDLVNGSGSPAPQASQSSAGNIGENGGGGEFNDGEW